MRNPERKTLKISKCNRALLHVICLLLFISSVSGCFGRDSDFDLAVTNNTPSSFEGVVRVVFNSEGKEVLNFTRAVSLKPETTEHVYNKPHVDGVGTLSIEVSQGNLILGNFTKSDWDPGANGDHMNIVILPAQVRFFLAAT